MMSKTARLFFRWFIIAALTFSGTAGLLPFSAPPALAASGFYVNDDDTTGDVFCTAIGDDANSGLSAALPKRTIQAILDTYNIDPGAGGIIHIDTGAYAENVAVAAQDSGLTLLGAGAALTTIDGGNAGSCVTLNSLTQGNVFNITFSSGNATDGGGIAVNSSSNITADNCIFSANTAENGGGIFIDSSNGTNFTNCIFSDNTAENGGGMFIDSSNGTAVTGCTFTGNGAYFGGGVFVKDSDEITVAGCSFSNNSAEGGGGIMIRDTEGITVTGCSFTGNDAQLSGGMLIYSSDDATATNCVFTGNTSPIGGGLTVALTDGIAITGCSFTGNDAMDGGGIYLANNLNTAVSTCTFSGNTAEDWGGGMYADGMDGTTVTGCTFTGNTAGDGGGLDIDDSDGVTVTGCTFYDNTAENGGGFFIYSNLNTNVSNSIFSGNTAEYGGGVDIELSDGITLINCTIFGNTAMQGGGLHTYDSTDGTAIHNSILWGDSLGEINDEGTNTIVSYSNVQGGWAGTGNIDADPLFVDAAGGNLHLQSAQGHWIPTGWMADSYTSPCIDAGDPASTFANEPAPNGGRVNMGAYGNSAQASRTLLPVIAPPPPPNYVYNVTGSQMGIITGADGTTQYGFSLTSNDNALNIFVPSGITALDGSGQPLQLITTALQTVPPPPPPGVNIIGPCFSLGPSGATFDPAITITLNYQDADVPAGIAETELTLAYYDETAGEWVILECTVDPETNTITAQVSHFTDYAIIGELPVPVFSLSDIAATPSGATPGEPVTVSASIANTGSADGLYHLVLKVNGQTMEEKDISVAAGGVESAGFVVSFDQPGTYLITLGGTAPISLVIAPVPQPVPAPTTEAVPVPPPATQTPVTQEVITPPASSPTSPTSPIPLPASASDTNWFLIALYIGVGVLLVIFLVYRFTHRRD